MERSWRLLGRVRERWRVGIRLGLESEFMGVLVCGFDRCSILVDYRWSLKAAV